MLLWLSWCGQLVADEVFLSTGKGPNAGRARRSGVIVDYTGERLVLRSASGRDESIDAARVVEIRATWNPQHVAGDAALKAGRFADALRAFRAAREAERRPWVQRQLLAQEAATYYHSGQIAFAGDTFLTVLRTDRATPHLPSIPLAWQRQTVGIDIERRAGSWMQEKVPAAQLMGASWLLSTPRRNEAIEVLRQLVTDSDPRVAFLADAQLWRTQLVTADANQLRQWEQRRERMPESIAWGPAFLLGEAYRQQKQPQQAALAYLRVPILFPEQYSLSAAALRLAAGELEQLQQVDSAARLYREILTDYAASQQASEARQRLQELTQEAAAGRSF